ncbi:MAG TPA: methyl-accepting chemotaxis protein, partial [Polyangia bacterium]|nr:methyl-accepting chemotaxis protein [Polyangia bacterium]
MTTPAAPPQKGRALDLVIVAAALLALGSAAAWFLMGQSVKPAATTAPVEDLYAVALDAPGAAAGDAEALGNLEKELKRLREVSRAHEEATWAQDPKFARVINNASVVLGASKQLGDAASAAREARELVAKLLAEIGTLASNLNGPSLEAAVRPLERFEVRAQRLQLDVSALATGTANPSQAAQRLAESSDYLGQVIKGFKGTDTGLGLPKVTGADAQQRLKAVETLYNELDNVVRRAVNAAPQLPAAQVAAKSVSEDARALAIAAGRGAFDVAPVGQNPLAYLPGVLAIAALVGVVLIWLGVKRLRETVDRYRLAMETQRKETDRNQQAILRLLDELSSLADGDLTVQATVTEDITGAIADSINYAVDALRGLVTTINQSAIHLDSAARQTQALSAHLAKASGAQAKQIASATESASGMAAATEEVSGNAERAADVARHSVEVAHKGGDAVRRTIDGMNTIRETIQETSKRIKRLGESSQEIGNI